MNAYEKGRDARMAGNGMSDLPDEYTERFTKLGTRVPNDDGLEWQRGWNSIPRITSRKEVEAATRLTDLGQFRSRFRRDR